MIPHIQDDDDDDDDDDGDDDDDDDDDGGEDGEPKDAHQWGTMRSISVGLRENWCSAVLSLKQNYTHKATR